MRSVALLAILLLLPGVAPAKDNPAGGYHFLPDLTDVESLQRGARIFVNYCMGCHSASYMRYNRLGTDLDMPEETLKSNFMFGTKKTGATMDIAMKGVDGERFFGVAPPDLSVIARARSADWLYGYFLTFYRDPSRPSGMNNLVFKDVAMPHVLWELQGYLKPVYQESRMAGGATSSVIESLEQDTPGTMSAEEYRRTIGDLVNFLVYLSEPAKLQRLKVGPWVILYLLVFLVVAWFLKKEFWKDIH